VSARGRAWLPAAAVAVTMILWASAFVGIRHLGESFSPGPLALGRLLVGAACLGAVSLARGYVAPVRREWWSILAIGVLWFGVYNVALNAGELSVDAGTASMILQTSPLLIAVLAAAFLGERFTTTLALGLAVAFAGVALIGLTSPDSGAAGSTAIGVALCLLCAVVYSVSVILQKPLMQRLPAIQVTWLACTVGALCCLPFATTLWREAQAASAADLGWLAYLGIFPTAIAFTTYAYALGHMSASRLGVTTYLVPPITIGLAWLFLREVPAPLAYVGGGLALLGVAIARRAPASARVTPGGHDLTPLDGPPR
jgi:drug/metabolite transporter (DMT)-like permease